MPGRLLPLLAPHPWNNLGVRSPRRTRSTQSLESDQGRTEAQNSFRPAIRRKDRSDLPNRQAMDGQQTRPWT